VPFPLTGTGATPTRIDKRKGSLPVTPISTAGGNFPRWRNATTLEFLSGPRYFSYDVESKKTAAAPITLQVPRPLPTGKIALTGARIITLDHRKVIERGVVVVTGGRIVCAGACGTAGADRVIDVKGKTIVPGFVDMHAHHHRDHEGVLPRHNWESAIYMAHGVTTTLDNSMWSENVFPTAEMIEAGLTIGPRTFSSGDPLYSGDAERPNEISSYKVAEENIDRLVSWGCHHDEAVHAAAARPAPVDLRHRPKAQTARHGGRRRSRVQPEHGRQPRLIAARHRVGEKLGLGHDLLHRAVRQQHAVGDIRDLVAALRLVHIMSRDEDGEALSRERVNLVPEFAPRLRVDARGRLVEQKEMRIGQGAGAKREPLLPAAGQRARELLLAPLQAEDA